MKSETFIKNDMNVVVESALQGKLNYELVGLSRHRGQTPNTGHYFTYDNC